MDTKELPGIIYAIGTLTSDQIRNLATNPIQVFNAYPGRRVLVQTAIFCYQPNTIAFTPGANIVLRHADQNGPFASTEISSGIFSQTTRTEYTVGPYLGGGTDSGIQSRDALSNSPVLLCCLGDAPIGMDADGTLLYYIIANTIGI